jgi:hypothetical protein
VAAPEGKLDGMKRLATWTTNQLSGIGLLAGLVAVMLWLFYGRWPHIVGWPFIAALGIAAACGILMLAITLRDLKYRSGRGSRLKPIRAFDVIVGLLLAVPSIVELQAILPEGMAQIGL